MTTQVKLQVIDADAHVVETERTWDYLEPSEQKLRPLLYSSPDKSVSDYWLINGELGRPYFPPLSEQKIEQISKNAGRAMGTPKEAREMNDIQMRLDHMDELGVDVQVLHNTIWLETVTTWPETQAALCRSWNKWLADIWKQGKGRLRWSCVVPDLMVDEARMYRLIRTAEYEQHELRISSNSDRFELFTFTFGAYEKLKEN